MYRYYKDNLLQVKLSPYRKNASQKRNCYRFTLSVEYLKYIKLFLIYARKKMR